MFSSIIFAILIQSILAFAGIFLVSLGFQKIKKFTNYLVSFSVGTFLGVIFFDLIPESIEMSSVEKSLLWVLLGFLIFFILSRVLFWYHHHEEDHHDHSDMQVTGSTVILGGTLHNFIDGVIIAGAFFAGQGIGIATSLAVLLHEMPHKLSDFFVLTHIGFSKNKALFWSVITSLASIFGAVLSFFFLQSVNNLLPIILAITAGNFLYLSASDLLPELNHSHKKGTGLIFQFLLMLLGVFIMWILVESLHH